MKSLVELAYDKHKDWINIVKSFGCNPSLAEDIVQSMYLQLICDINKGLDLGTGTKSTVTTFIKYCEEYF